VSIEFLLTTFIVVATPGTGVIYTLAAGLSRGARASVIAAVGCTLGIIPHIVAAITGLAALLNASARAFETLKFLGVAYLLYMAWAMWNEKGAVTFNQEAAPRSALRVIGSGILINILNPKLTIFFFAFLPQFREHQRAACPATNAGAECRLHAGHARRLRGVRGLCRFGAEPSGLTPAGDELDAPCVRRFIRRAQRPAGIDRSVIAPGGFRSAEEQQQVIRAQSRPCSGR